MTAPETDAVIEFLRGARAFLESHHDVEDGGAPGEHPYQKPNWAMRATNAIDEALEIVEQHAAVIDGARYRASLQDGVRLFAAIPAARDALHSVLHAKIIYTGGGDEESIAECGMELVAPLKAQLEAALVALEPKQ